jgi:DNA mismatch repair protein MutS
MIEVSSILHKFTPKSLVILDEVGKGISIYVSVSIAWAVVEYIHNYPSLRVYTHFATHYQKLPQPSDLLLFERVYEPNSNL